MLAVMKARARVKGAAKAHNFAVRVAEKVDPVQGNHLDALQTWSCHAPSTPIVGGGAHSHHPRTAALHFELFVPFNAVLLGLVWCDRASRPGNGGT